MECISVFDMLKIGIGPSSSHTLGPWRATERWIKELKTENLFDRVERIKVDLYGSLSLTGKGHATDLALMLGLTGLDPETFPVETIEETISSIRSQKALNFNGENNILFSIEDDIIFNKKFLPFHANALTFTAFTKDEKHASTFYSIGGGFVVKEAQTNSLKNEVLFNTFPFPIEKASELLSYCSSENKKISEIIFENEKSLRTEPEINSELNRIWGTMLECMYIGCHTEGNLPGGLNVRRRASAG